MGVESKHRRVSAFHEVGLDDQPRSPTGFDVQKGFQDLKRRHCCRPPSVERIEEEGDETVWDDNTSSFSSDEEIEEKSLDQLPLIEPTSSVGLPRSLLTRHTMFLVLVLIILYTSSNAGLSRTIIPSASGTTMHNNWMDQSISNLWKRSNSPTDVC